MRLLVLSVPGSDARTHALRLAQALAVPLLDGGALLREAVAAGTPLGLRARELLVTGVRLPDEIMLDVLAARLALSDVRAGFILDKYPHDPAQARALDAMLARLGQPIDAAVQLGSEANLTRPLPDDVAARRDELRARHALLVEYYRMQGKLTALAQLGVNG